MSPCEAVERGPRLDWRGLWILVAVVALCRLTALQSCPIYDDAFITYRYARNFASGLGMQFNPGAPWEPVLGTTTPGYAVLLAGIHSLGVPMIKASIGINILADMASAVLIACLLKRAWIPTVVTLLAFAGLPQIARISVGGMEAPVFVMVALLATWAARVRRPVLAGLAAAVGCTLRPEASILVVVLATLHFDSKRNFLRYSVPVAVFGILYAGLLYSVFGTPIPQSVTAKADNHETIVHSARMLEITAEAFFPHVSLLILLPFVLTGLWVCVRRDCPGRAFGSFCFLMVCAYVVVRPKTWGWYYYAPLTAWVLWLGIGAAQFALFFKLEARLVGSRFLAWGPAAMGTLALAGAAYVTWSRPDHVSAQVYDRIGAWGHSLEDPDPRIMASDIGAVGWMVDVEILDSMGLVWPEATQYESQIDAIRSQRPDYVFLVANQGRVRPFVRDPILSAEYVPIDRFNSSGEVDLVPDPESLPVGWIQDYLLYERVIDSTD